jgi:hypothetical protein
MVLMIPGDRKTEEAGGTPDQKDVSVMMKYNEELAKAGVLLALDGLHPSSKGARVRFSGGKRTVSDGPFTEAKEIIGGYWMLQVKSKDEVMAWVARCPALEGDVLEVRQVFEMSDFGPAIEQREAALTAEIGKRLEANKQRAQ